MAVAHQTASLFSSGERVQVCDELVTKSLYVQINSELCASAVENYKLRRFSGKISFFQPMFFTRSTVYLQNLGKSGAGSPHCDDGHEENPASAALSVVHHVFTKPLKCRNIVFGIIQCLRFRSPVNCGLFLVPRALHIICIKA